MIQNISKHHKNCHYTLQMTLGMVMASLPSTPTLLLGSSSTKTTKSATFYSFSSYSSVTSHPERHGLNPFSPWSGLKHLGVSIPPNSLNLGKKRRCKGMVVHASLFGVGAPEALVIGVVALLVFGPKGLAEVARNLGKTLRAFQPTIKELQEVSREFKSSLEREIGLDDIPSSTQSTYSSNRTSTTFIPTPTAGTEDSQSVVDPNGTPSSTRAYTSEEYLKITEEQLKASVAQQQSHSPPPGESNFENQAQPQVNVKETAAVPPSQRPEG
ncbi:MttA_Hcf106 domain-containing protein [Cephalotus follicularis]|uniref:MttA_Hcf106 domain-containing protein n=1 Tax=Cephalotus follicularis TaxID=3775 RepID=A0A1Q3C7L3_CEPFO|nr:MttA_Hcf106 domain-containing protein [Cephalotus follicularis]